MSSSDDTNKDSGGRQYALYQQTVYINGIFGGQKPVVTCDPALLRQRAKEAMTPEAFSYVAGSAGEGSTADANRAAFRQWKIVPRMMQPTVPRDLTVTLFGRTYPSPLLQAPVGVQSAYHADKEVGVAAACAQLGVPFIMSTASSSTFDEVAAASGDNPRWFQLYWPRTDALTASLLRTARAKGFEVLVVTLDTYVLAWRPSDLDLTFLPFLQGQGCAVGFNDPVLRRLLAEQHDGATPESDLVVAARHWLSETVSGDAHGWDEIATLRKHWDGPIVLKGIQDVRDARRAAEAGVDGIVVSNHGGRQVDGAVASLDVLPGIVEAVGDKLTVLFDSGIRTGADVVKALSLGAEAVLVGRPVMYGLGIAGKEGAQHALASILADFDLTMGLSGFKSVKGLSQDNLKRVSYPGEVKSSL